MPIQLSQADLDAKRVLVKDAVVAYHQALRTYKDEMGSLPAHLDRTDNPHGLTKAQIGLGNVPNAAPATVQQSLDGFLSNKLSVPSGTAAQVEDRLHSLKSVGYKKRTAHKLSQSRVLSKGVYEVNVITPTEFMVVLNSGDRLTLALKQGSDPKEITWSSGVVWARNPNSVYWGEWVSQVNGHGGDSAEGNAFRDQITSGALDTDDRKYRLAESDSGSGAMVYYEISDRDPHGPSDTLVANKRWMVEFWNSDGTVYGKMTDLGVTQNTLTHSQTPHTSDDRLYAIPHSGDRLVDYVGTLSPGGGADHTPARFTQDVLDALAVSNGSQVDPSTVQWEIMHFDDLGLVYFPTKPLFGAISYTTLRERSLLNGDKLITLPTRGGFQSGEWYLPTHFATFRVVTPSLGSQAYYQALSSLLAEEIRPRSNVDSFKSYTAEELPFAGDFWLKEPTASGDLACAQRDGSLNSFLPQTTLAAWRPILIPQYETTLD